MRDDDRIRNHTGVRNIIQGDLLGHPLHTISYTIPAPADRSPSKKETPRSYIGRDEIVWVYSWSVHCNFVRDGKGSIGAERAPPYLHQPRLIFPSWRNVRQTAAVATLCVLCVSYSRRDTLTTISIAHCNQCSVYVLYSQKRFSQATLPNIIQIFANIIIIFCLDLWYSVEKYITHKPQLFSY